MPPSHQVYFFPIMLLSLPAVTLALLSKQKAQSESMKCIGLILCTDIAIKLPLGNCVPSNRAPWKVHTLYAYHANIYRCSAAYKRLPTAFPTGAGELFPQGISTMLWTS
jgi:hypothetical protein